MEALVEIWLAAAPTFTDSGVTLDNYQQTHVKEAEIKLEAHDEEALCERAFEFSQNNSRLCWKQGVRSSSVGDVLVVKGAGVFVISPSGVIQLC